MTPVYVHFRITRALVYLKLCPLCTTAVLTITNLCKCHVFKCLLKCLVAHHKQVAIFWIPCMGGDTVIQLFDCIYLCWAKCQWSLNEVQDSVPDQQMLYNLKHPRGSTAVLFTEQEWAELAVYLAMHECCGNVHCLHLCECISCLIWWLEACVSAYWVSEAEWPLPLVMLCRSVKTVMKPQ